jgi:hypothetical protein
MHGQLSQQSISQCMPLAVEHNPAQNATEQLINPGDLLGQM